MLAKRVAAETTEITLSVNRLFECLLVIAMFECQFVVAVGQDVHMHTSPKVRRSLETPE